MSFLHLVSSHWEENVEVRVLLVSPAWRTQRNVRTCSILRRLNTRMHAVYTASTVRQKMLWFANLNEMASIIAILRSIHITINLISVLLIIMNLWEITKPTSSLVVRGQHPVIFCTVKLQLDRHWPFYYLLWCIYNAFPIFPSDRTLCSGAPSPY